MALNKTFDTEILLNGADITNYCSLDDFTPSDKNLDHSQIFAKAELRINNSIGAPFSVKIGDMITVTVQTNRAFFRVLEVDKQRGFSKINLQSIFEDLKNKRFLVLDGETFKPNPLLAPFLNESNLITTPTLATLIKMIITLTYGEEPDLQDTGEQYTYDLNTGIIGVISSVFDSITISNNLITWAAENETKPDELLKSLQKIFCFTINVGLDNCFNIIRLPYMKILSDSEVPSRRYIDPPFFAYLGILDKLNPAIGLDKVSYSSNPVFITQKKKAVKILEGESVLFKYLYRDDIEVDEITLPENLGLSEVVKPLQFQFDSVNYILKQGIYSAYQRYFSYIDIGQSNSLSLDYQISEGYNKSELLFTNEDGQEDFTDPKNCRKCTFDNSKYSVSCIINDPQMKNSIRG